MNLSDLGESLYRTLRQCIDDLEKHGYVLRISDEVDPYLEMAEIQRRVFAAGGPALLFEKVKGSPFPAVSNLFGTAERARFIFRKTLPAVKTAVQLKGNPLSILRHPWQMRLMPRHLWHALPKKMHSRHPFTEIGLDQLPQITSWPKDGGPFITLPQVLSLDPTNASILKSNLGMYRVQMAGNAYEAGREVGLHYQIHRGIGIHHAAARELGQPLKVSIFVGGPPAHSFAAVMPLPEGMLELAFAGLLAGRRFRYYVEDGYTLSADADFCITGTIAEGTKPEGPFGDHLGYYSLKHDFPVLKINKVYHRPDAIWPFTVVGRPPQEDTIFGKLIHEMTGTAVPQSIPGIHAVHAVDAAGVHTLLLAIGSERYMPYGPREPRELLTLANAVLGFGQLSLAKYLFILAKEDAPGLDINDIAAVFSHVLERVDWRRDVHFQTRTTMDTLDYSAPGINSGSKVVIAAAGSPIRALDENPGAFPPLPGGFGNVRLVLPGILALQGPKWRDADTAQTEIQTLARQLQSADLAGWPLLVVVDDSAFAAENLNNFLWVTFTRSDPAADIFGIGAFTKQKHWGCSGSLIIDARIKTHHAPPLESDPQVECRVNTMAATGGSLYNII